MSEDVKTDETQPEEISTPSSTAATTTETATPETESQFDAASFELDYGLPQGTLADAKDENAAMDALRGYTDRLLAAGIQLKPATPAKDSGDGSPGGAAPAQAAQPAEAKAGDNEPPAWAKPIIERINAIEQQSQTASQAHFQNQMRELDDRIMTEIDTWASPRYGTSQSRGYKQTQELQQLGQLIRTQAAGYLAQGQTPPRIETLLRQVRAFHDPDYKPGKPAAATTPLGTPGASASRATEEEPRSIHHAFASRNW